VTDAPTLELLAWVSARRRTYAEAMDAWRTHCPRLTVWEDAVLGGFIRVVRRPDGQVVELTEAGEAALASGNRATSAIV
jgi:hypothetical protein